jgi:membrane protease YdiL (CAAX protease family)
MQVGHDYALRKRSSASNSFANWQTSISVAAYLMLWVGSVAAIHAKARLDLTEPLLIFAIVGVGFSTLAWLLTRRPEALPFEVRNPGTECVLLAICLMLVVWFLTWGIDALKTGVQREPWQMLTMLGTKLALFVLVPLALFCTFGKYKMNELLPASSKPKHLRVALWMSLVLILFQTAFGRGVSEIRHSGLPLWAVAVGLPFAYVWLLVEVGLVEEFFFRALLQSRLSALLRSEVAGVMLMALLFGLAHAPGLHYRTAATLEGVGPSPSWSVAIAYSIAMISVTGIFLGVLWARTRNILVLIIVHAAGDLVPNLIPFFKAW